MTTNIHFLSYFVHFFLEWEKFQTKVLEKIRTHILCSVTFFFRKSCRLRENVENYFRVGQATNDNTAREHCMLFHCNNGCTKASQFYAPRTWTVLFLLSPRSWIASSRYFNNISSLFLKLLIVLCLTLIGLSPLLCFGSCTNCTELATFELSFEHP